MTFKPKKSRFSRRNPSNGPYIGFVGSKALTVVGNMSNKGSPEDGK